MKFMRRGIPLVLLPVFFAGSVFLLAQEVDPVLEPAELRPPPGSGEAYMPGEPDVVEVPQTSSPASSVSSAPATELYRNGHYYTSLEELPLRESPPSLENYVLLGQVQRSADLLYRINNLPPYLPLFVYVNREDAAFAVYAGPLSGAEMSQLKARRNFLWVP